MEQARQYIKIRSGWGLRLYKTLGFLAVVLSAWAVLHEPTRVSLQGYLFAGERRILSLLESQDFEDSFRIVKVRTRNGIVVEVYKSQEGAGTSLFQVLDLAGERDAYIDVNHGTTNLLLKNIDEEGLPELLVPTFDQNMVARLHMYKFHRELGRFLPFQKSGN